MEPKEVYYVGTTSVAQEQPHSPFDRLAVSVERLHELRKMSGHIADQLTGQQPAQSATSTDKIGVVGGGGLLDGLDRQSAVIADLARAIYENLSRIQSRL